MTELTTEQRVAYLERAVESLTRIVAQLVEVAEEQAEMPRRVSEVFEDEYGSEWHGDN